MRSTLMVLPPCRELNSDRSFLGRLNSGYSVLTTGWVLLPTRSLETNQPAANRFADSFCAVGNAEFLRQCASMRLHGALFYQQRRSLNVMDDAVLHLGCADRKHIGESALEDRAG